MMTAPLKAALFILISSLFCIWSVPVASRLSSADPDDAAIGKKHLDESLQNQYDYVNETYESSQQNADASTPYYSSDMEYLQHWLSGLEYEMSADYDSAIEEYGLSLSVQLYEKAAYEPLLDLARVHLRIGEFTDAYDCLIKYNHRSVPYVAQPAYGEELAEWGLSDEGLSRLNSRRGLAQEWIDALLAQASSGRIVNEAVIAEYLPSDAGDSALYSFTTPDRTYVITSYSRKVDDEDMPGHFMTDTHCELLFGEVDDNGYKVISGDTLSSRESDELLTTGYLIYYCSEISDVIFTTWVDGDSVVHAAIVSGVTQAAGMNLYAPFVKIFRLMPGHAEEIAWEGESPSPGKLRYEFSTISRGLIFWMQDPDTDWWQEPFNIVLYEYSYYDGLMHNYGLIKSSRTFTQDTFPTRPPSYEDDWLSSE